MCLIFVVMGIELEKVCFLESQKLIIYGFCFFEIVKSYDVKQELLEFDIWKGSVNILKLGIEEVIWLMIFCGSVGSIMIDLEVFELLEVLIIEGEKIGIIKFMLNNEIVVIKFLIVLEIVEEGGLIKCLWYMIVLLVKSWF